MAEVMGLNATQRSVSIGGKSSGRMSVKVATGAIKKSLLRKMSTKLNIGKENAISDT